MATDSTAAGFLAPDLPGPKYDSELEDLFHDLIQGITGITASLIRPRWQPDPPNQPDFQTNWIAFGVTIMKSDWDPYLSHDPAAASGTGTSTQSRGEVIHVQCSFYGPQCQGYERRFRDGLHVEQNREGLIAEKIKVVELLEPVTLPALLKEKWVKRIDSKLVCQRWVSRTYQIRSFLESSGDLLFIDEVPPVHFTVNP